MKTLNKKLVGLLSLFLLIQGYNNSFAQAPAKSDVSITLNYFNANNKFPYIIAKVKTKVDGRFQPVNDVSMKLYLDSVCTANFIGEAVSNDKGEAASMIPSTLKNQWSGHLKHTFLAKFAGNAKYEPADADLTVSKARLLIDSADDRKVVVTVQEMKGDKWTPVKDVEMKIAIKRLGGDLPISETQTYTTDSTGQVSADFKRDSIPGDVKGLIVLIAKVEDNDAYGNLSVEKVVPWGAKFTPVSVFNKRTLFANGHRAPIWLQLIAFSIMFTVWGILVGLVINLFRIKKLGLKP